MNISDDDLLLICSKLGTNDLESFMKTSQRNYDICKFEWNKRHKIRYGAGKHKILSDTDRDKLKKCMKNLKDNDIILMHDLHLAMQEENYPGELRDNFNYLYEEWGNKYDRLVKQYGEDTAEELQIPWDESKFNTLADELDNLYFSKLLDSVHSDESLLEINEYLKQIRHSYKKPYINCTKNITINR